ncbi:MAG: hypothetical protein JSR38_15325 [Proteobacteria bacterium]|nr:hypothetical protein [Pseudomonadota bacterium]
MHATPQQMVTAYEAACQALAAAALRNLGAAAFDDPEIGAIAVECSRDGSVDVTLLDHAGHHVGGYSL